MSKKIISVKASKDGKKAHTRVVEDKTPKLEIDYKEALQLAKGYHSVKALQKAVIESKDPWDIIEFASEVADADIEEIQNEFEEMALADEFDAGYLLSFAEKVPNANMKSLESAIIELGDPDTMHDFADRIEEADADRIQKAWEDQNDFFPGDYHAAFAILTGKNEPTQSLIIEYQSVEDALYLAEHGQGVELESLQEVVLNSNDYLSMYRFAQIDGSDKEKLLEKFDEGKIDLSNEDIRYIKSYYDKDFNI